MRKLAEFWDRHPILAFLLFLSIGFMSGEAFKAATGTPTVFHLMAAEQSSE